MSKELADIQDLKSAFISHCKELGCDKSYIKVCENKFSNIETTLKSYEALVEIHTNTISAMKPAEKKLKALEIIVDKQVDIKIFTSSAILHEHRTPDAYNFTISDVKRYLTQEEFDVVKEALK